MEATHKQLASAICSRMVPVVISCGWQSSLLWLGLLGTLPLGGIVPAESRADDVESAIRELLTVGWTSSPAANRETERLYRAAAPRGNWQLDYAYALAKMRQWRYGEVVPLAERLAAEEHSELVGRQLLVWLHTLRKNYPVALMQMDRMAAALPSLDADLAADAVEARRHFREEKVRFLGAVFGYLSGPQAGALSDFERESRLRRIVRRLSEEESAMFQEEMLRVIDEYHVRTDERDELVDRELREAERLRAERLAEIDALRRRVVEQLDALAEAERRAQRERDEQADRIRGEDAPLRERLITLDTEMAGVSRNLAILNVDILRFEDLLAIEPDPVIRAGLLVDLNRLSALAAGYARDLARLDVDAARVRSQRLTLANQLQQVETRYRQVLQQSRVRQEQFRQEIQRAEVEERRLLRERPRTSGQARALQMTKQAFSTYLPFPLEEEKQFLLETLR
jgi:hypothetical protein